MSKLEVGTGVNKKNYERTKQIEAILHLATLARDDAQKLELKFEAYLLEIATIGLSEQLQKCRPSKT